MLSHTTSRDVALTGTLATGTPAQPSQPPTALEKPQGHWHRTGIWLECSVPLGIDTGAATCRVCCMVEIQTLFSGSWPHPCLINDQHSDVCALIQHLCNSAQFQALIHHSTAPTHRFGTAATATRSHSLRCVFLLLVAKGEIASFVRVNAQPLRCGRRSFPWLTRRAGFVRSAVARALAPMCGQRRRGHKCRMSCAQV